MSNETNEVKQHHHHNDINELKCTLSELQIHLDSQNGIDIDMIKKILCGIEKLLVILCKANNEKK